MDDSRNLTDANLKVCAVVVTFNGEKIIESCINSLLRSTIPVYVIVVDNKSLDATVPLIRAKYSNIEVIESDRNLGFGKANNIGIIAALNKQADYIFLLNQDAWVTENCIEELIRTHREHPRFGVLSPAHYNSSTGFLDKQFELHVNRAGNKRKHDPPADGHRSITAINFINAAAWLLPANCLKKAGGFDPVFPHYSEDVDFCNRTRYHGFNIGIYFPALAYHERSQESVTYEMMTAARRKDRKFFDCLAAWKDINQPFMAAIARSTFRQAMSLARYSLKGKPGLAAEEFSIAVRLVKNIKTIMRHRQISKLATGPFLATAHTSLTAFFP